MFSELRNVGFNARHQVCVTGKKGRRRERSTGGLSLTLYILEAPPGRLKIHWPGLSHVAIHTFRKTKKVSITNWEHTGLCKIGVLLVMYKWGGQLVDSAKETVPMIEKCQTETHRINKGLSGLRAGRGFPDRGQGIFI